LLLTLLPHFFPDFFVFAPVISKKNQNLKYAATGESTNEQNFWIGLTIIMHFTFHLIIDLTYTFVSGQHFITSSWNFAGHFQLLGCFAFGCVTN